MSDTNLLFPLGKEVFYKMFDYSSLMDALILMIGFYLLFNPLTPRSDQQVTSPYNI